MSQERGALHLLDVVEASDADVAFREALDAGVDFRNDFIRVLAAVHGELPHNPVTVS